MVINIFNLRPSFAECARRRDAPHKECCPGAPRKNAALHHTTIIELPHNFRNQTTYHAALLAAHEAEQSERNRKI